MEKLKTVTLEDIAQIMAEAREMGVAINMQIIPLSKAQKADESTDEEA